MAHSTESSYQHPHNTFVLERMPSWLKALDKPAIDTLGASLLSEQYTGAGNVAPWFTQASPARQRALLRSQQARATARQAVSAAVGDFKGVMAFAEPLLRERLSHWLGHEVDVHDTVLVQVREQMAWQGLQQSYTPVSQSLLLAALHNFNQGQAFGVDSALVAKDGYRIEYVTAPVSAVDQPYHQGDQTLPFNELLPQRGDYPLLHFTPGARLALTPEAFARECRTLDLGQRYQDYLTCTLLSPSRQTAVRSALLAARSADLQCQRQVALLKGHIDAATFAMLGQLLAGQALLRNGQAMHGVQLQMLRAPVHDVVLFVPRSEGDAHQPCIAWIPGDSQAPLRQYPHRGAFATDLATRLRQPAYRDEFLGRVSLAVRPDFDARLRAQLARSQPAFDVKTPAIAGTVLEHQHDRHMAWLHSQAKCLAVPTAQVDYLATLERWEGWLESGVNVLNFAAMFIPALGPIMLPVIAAQAMGELYHGLADLADHQWASGWAHLGGLALNVVLGAAVHQGVQAFNGIDPFVDNLLRVQLPDGQSRLWNPDITPYAAETRPDPAWRANDQGLYEVQGQEYVLLDGKLYPSRLQPSSGARVLYRPDEPGAYAPKVRSNGRGAWLHEGEQPLDWSHERLLRRLWPRAAGLDDARLGQALEVSGVDEAVVRQALMEGNAAPLELTDTLDRFALAGEVDAMIASVRGGGRWASAWPVPIQVLAEHPRWPETLVLQVFEGAEPWGAFSEYGNVKQPNPQWVSVVRADLASADRMGQVATALGDTTCDLLLGTPAASGRAVRVEGLQNLLADQLQGQRPSLLQRYMTADVSVRVPGAEALVRDFPSLDNAQVTELVNGASFAEMQRLQAGRVPLRMAEEALALLRARRINRALGGLYQPALANADSARLRAAWGDSLPEPIDRAQVAQLLGIQGAGRGGFRSPVRVGAHIGYLASGRGQLPTVAADLVRKIGTLFPNLELLEVDQLISALDLSDPQLRAWLQAREVEIQRVETLLKGWVSAGVAEYGQLTAGAVNRSNVAAQINRALRRLTPRVVAHGGERVGFELDLSGLRLDGLPALEADFSHIKSLVLQHGELVDVPVAFLEQLTGLRHLDLGHNQLTRLPDLLERLPGLTRLRLAHNRLRWDESSARVLSRLVSLRELNLAYNPLGEAPDMAHLIDLRGAVLTACELTTYPRSVLGLPRLEVLDLRNNAIEALPAEVLLLSVEPDPHTLRINRDTHLEGNPLSEATLRLLRAYRTRYGHSFGVEGLLDGVVRTVGGEGAVRWLQGVPPALRNPLQATWTALRAEPGAQAFFDVIEQLTDSRDFHGAASFADLRERVWSVINAAHAHTELREVLFNQAVHGVTCGDGAALLFSLLQVRALVFEATLASGEEQTALLLKLAKGLFRLDEVEKAAFVDIAARTEAVDAAEVQLVYRTRLAQALELPGQPKGMRFAPLAEVSADALAVTEQAILAMDGTPAMIDAVVARDFWVEGLRKAKAYEARFAALDNSYFNLLTALDADALSGAINSAAYTKKLEQLMARRRAAEKRLVREITQEIFDREVQVTEL